MSLFVTSNEISVSLSLNSTFQKFFQIFFLTKCFCPMSSWNHSILHIQLLRCLWCYSIILNGLSLLLIPLYIYKKVHPLD